MMFNFLFLIGPTPFWFGFDSQHYFSNNCSETVSILDEPVPLSIRLKPNYPNPFNPITTIRFDIPAETQHAVSLQVYDISGRMVETLVNEKLKPGTFKINWNASNHSSGVYFLKMEIGQYIKTQKMILLK